MSISRNITFIIAILLIFSIQNWTTITLHISLQDWTNGVSFFSSTIYHVLMNVHTFRMLGGWVEVNVKYCYLHFLLILPWIRIMGEWKSMQSMIITKNQNVHNVVAYIAIEHFFSWLYRLIYLFALALNAKLFHHCQLATFFTIYFYSCSESKKHATYKTDRMD